MTRVIIRLAIYSQIRVRIQVLLYPFFDCALAVRSKGGKEREKETEKKKKQQKTRKTRKKSKRKKKTVFFFVFCLGVVGFFVWGVEFCILERIGLFFFLFFLFFL